MATFFDFLLSWAGFAFFWLGFVVTIVGTLAVALLLPQRVIAIVGVLVYFFMSGAMFMGTAGVNLSYSPPTTASWFIAVTLWLVLVASLGIASIKSTAKDIQGGTTPPK